MNLLEKIVSSHLVSGEMKIGSEISFKIDQTLTQDSLGTMAYLHLEGLNVEKVKTKLAVSYVDHLTLQQGYENADDQKYLQTVASKYGIVFSKPGNGICHQLHLERMSRPGWTLLGSDSHTCTSGAAGMLAVGAGGLDIAVAMAGGPFFMTYPRVIKVNLHGELQPWVTVKDVILELLKILTTKGNVGCVIEYGGSGIDRLSVPERATITNMGAELGITTSLFPSDEVTRIFFRAQGREDQWSELLPAPDAHYDRTMDIDLEGIEPNIALPHSPDNVCKIREITRIPVDQVLIGSCTNSSFLDLMKIAAILKGRKAHPDISFGVTAGSRQALRMITANGALTDIVDSGARILESSCGFCAGYGQSPHQNAVSIRTNNRNFEGRSGTKDAQVFLVSPESAAASALTGKITDPRDLQIDYPHIQQPEQFFIDDSMFVEPSYKDEVFRGPNIGTPPRNTEMPRNLKASVAIKLGDKITTDHILPAGSVSRFRSNIQKSSVFVFHNLEPRFAETCEKARAKGLDSVIVAGSSYGQGSSREHAAMCPMFLGVRVVIARSIERIHLTNLINFGITPLIFKDSANYENIQPDDLLEVPDIHNAIQRNEFVVANKTQKSEFIVCHSLTQRQTQIVLCGGLVNFMDKS